MFVLPMLMFLLYHRACDAIAEVALGGGVKCKHQFCKLIL